MNKKYIYHYLVTETKEYRYDIEANTDEEAKEELELRREDGERLVLGCDGVRELDTDIELKSREEISQEDEE